MQVRFTGKTGGETIIITKKVMYRGKELEVEKLKDNSTIKVSVLCPICMDIREVPYGYIVKNGHCLCQGCVIRKRQGKTLESGAIYGKWTVTTESGHSGKSMCICECGTKREVSNASLRAGTSKSCGCSSAIANKQKAIRLDKGATYGRLVVIDNEKHIGYSVCLCECGEECTVRNSNLKQGVTKSCGCIQKEIASKNRIASNKENSHDKHPNWKGGISSERTRVMSTSRYKEWRKSVFERDDYTCQICEVRGSELNAHHIKSYSENKEIRTNISNGVTLCKPCHVGFHKAYGRKNIDENMLTEYKNKKIKESAPQTVLRKR